jgi:hypothetical protein
MSDTEIASRALGYLGAQKIDSLGDNIPNAINANRYFEAIRKEVHELFDWSFARARVTLETTISPAPAFEWDNAFQLPTGFVKERHVWNALNEKIDYEVEGIYILTDEDTVYLKYTQLITNTNLYSPTFDTVFAYRLAMEIQELVTGGKGAKLRARLENGFAFALSQAEKLDGRRQYKTPPEKDSWTNSRTS